MQKIVSEPETHKVVILPLLAGEKASSSTVVGFADWGRIACGHMFSYKENRSRMRITVVALATPHNAIPFHVYSPRSPTVNRKKKYLASINNLF